MFLFLFYIHGDCNIVYTYFICDKLSSLLPNTLFCISYYYRLVHQSFVVSQQHHHHRRHHHQHHISPTSIVPTNGSIENSSSSSSRPLQKPYLMEVWIDNKNYCSSVSTLLKQKYGVRIFCAQFLRSLQIQHSLFATLFPSAFDPFNRMYRFILLFLVFGSQFMMTVGIIYVFASVDLSFDESDMNKYSYLASIAANFVIIPIIELSVEAIARTKV